MLKRGCDIIGLPVLSLATGERLGNVRDLVFDIQEMMIIMLLIDERGLFHGNKTIYFHEIYKFGLDAVIIQHKSCIQSGSSTSRNNLNYTTREHIINQEVITDEGENIGVVQDLLVSIENGKVHALILTDGFFHDIVEGRPILPLKSKVHFYEMSIVVPEQVKNEVQYNTGGLKKLLALE